MEIKEIEDWYKREVAFCHERGICPICFFSYLRPIILVGKLDPEGRYCDHHYLQRTAREAYNNVGAGI